MVESDTGRHLSPGRIATPVARGRSVGRGVCLKAAFLDAPPFLLKFNNEKQIIARSACRTAEETIGCSPAEAFVWDKIMGKRGYPMADDWFSARPIRAAIPIPITFARRSLSPGD